MNLPFVGDHIELLPVGIYGNRQKTTKMLLT
jgi:hypothetical protein